jgi:hypothetical protein
VIRLIKQLSLYWKENLKRIENCNVMNTAREESMYDLGIYLLLIACILAPDVI